MQKFSYRPDIDGLRALAIVPVILFHAGVGAFSGGFAGVDVFFVISGFLITSILQRDLAAGRYSLVRFYERRARRILPALVAIMLVTSAAACIILLREQRIEFSKALLGVFTFTANIVLWRQSGYFSPAAEENPLLHMWSLSVEEQFYVLFPVALAATWRFGSRWILALFGLAALLSLGLAEWGWRFEPTANFFLLPTRAFELLAGAICAFLMTEGFQPSRPVREGLSGLGLAMVLLAIFAFDEATPFPSVYALVPVIGAALLILSAGSDTAVGRILSHPAPVLIGLISYSAYLWHQPILALTRVQLGPALQPWHLLLGAAISLLIAYPTWRYVERPFRRSDSFLGRLDAKRILGGAATVCAAFIAIAVVGVKTDGLLFLDSPQSVRRAAILDGWRADRLAMIRPNACHFNSNDLDADPQRFIEAWDCRGTPDGSPADVAVYGDSHAADAAAALRAAGMSVLQLTGNDCSLDPFSRYGRSRCRLLLNAFLARAEEAGGRTVVIANLFTPEELAGDYLQGVLDLWSGHFDRTAILSPMPEFVGFDREYLRGGVEGAANVQPDLSAHQTFMTAVAGLAPPAGKGRIVFLDSPDLICAGACPVDLDHTPLVVDSGHLSLHGATVFGHRLAPRLAALASSESRRAEAMAQPPHHN